MTHHVSFLPLVFESLAEITGQAAAYGGAVKVEATCIGCYLEGVTNRKPFELLVSGGGAVSSLKAPVMISYFSSWLATTIF
jgi:hypothetical protein